MLPEARNPSRPDTTDVAVMVEVNLPDGWTTYVCRPDDVVEMSRELHAAAMRGDYGPIAPFVPE